MNIQNGGTVVKQCLPVNGECLLPLLSDFSIRKQSTFVAASPSP